MAINRTMKLQEDKDLKNYPKTPKNQKKKKKQEKEASPKAEPPSSNTQATTCRLRKERRIKSVARRQIANFLMAKSGE